MQKCFMISGSTLVAMSGLLGTRAPVSSDLSLILQIALLALLLTGFILGKRKTGRSLAMFVVGCRLPSFSGLLLCCLGWASTSCTIWFRLGNAVSHKVFYGL